MAMGFVFLGFFKTLESSVFLNFNFRFEINELIDQILGNPHNKRFSLYILF